jgi:hypothetical protein
MAFIVIIFKILVPIEQGTHCVSTTNTSPVILFRELIAVHTENFIQPINTLSGNNANFLILKLTVRTGVLLRTGQTSGTCSAGHLEQGISECNRLRNSVLKSHQ